MQDKDAMLRFLFLDIIISSALVDAERFRIIIFGVDVKVNVVHKYMYSNLDQNFLI